MLTPENSGASQLACDIVNDTFLALDGFIPMRQDPAHLALAAHMARVADIRIRSTLETKPITEVYEGPAPMTREQSTELWKRS